jgi:hypothetical protein
MNSVGGAAVPGRLSLADAEAPDGKGDGEGLKANLKNYSWARIYGSVKPISP